MPARLRTLVIAVVVGLLLSMFSPTASATPSRTSSKPTHLKTAKYTNWAGYQMQVAHPTSARATWTVPTATWQGRDGYSNQWVGLGGGTKGQGQLIQAGTESDNVCAVARQGRCLKSRSSYALWLETYPKQSQERITNLAITPGDKVDVQVSYHAGTAFFTLCNLSKATCVTAQRPSPTPLQVAEFVVERPSNATGHPLALGKFGSARFTGMSLSDNDRPVGLRNLPTTRMDMNNGHDLTATSDLDVVRANFTVGFHRPS